MTSNKNLTDILVVDNITVNYGPRVGLDKVSFRVKRGEIHAIFGPPDSGKSTLINVLSGRIQKTEGRILFDNQVLRKLSTKKAMKVGISAIHQNLYLYPKWSVFENLYLNKPIRKNFFLPDNQRMREIALNIFRELAVDIDLDTPVAYYPLSKLQMIQIVKSICFPLKLLLIDELPVKLTPEEMERFHYLLSLLHQKGVSIIYATSNMDEIFNLASRVTILKNGRVIETTKISDIDKMHLVKLTYSFMARRKELEESNFELFYLKNFYENIFNHIPFPIMVTDTKGIIIFLNTSIRELFKINSNEYTDKFFNNLFKLPAKSVKRIMDTIFSNKGPYFPGLELDLTESSQKLLMIPLFDSDQSFIGSLTIIKDKEKWKREELQKSLKLKVSPEKIMGWIAHEINNPVSIILNYLRVIKTEDSIENIRSNMENVEKEVKRIKHIIEKTVRGSEIKMEAFKKVRIDTLLSEVVDVMKPTSDQNNIILDLNARQGILADVDSDLFKQVMVNMILNAIEAMPGGGLVRISADLQKVEQDVYIVVTIQDNGKGIEEKDLQRIFEPFYTTKDHGEMSGLGLSICRDIISQYNGYITVNSKLNRGTTFQVFLPYH